MGEKPQKRAPNITSKNRNISLSPRAFQPRGGFVPHCVPASIDSFILCRYKRVGNWHNHNECNDVKGSTYERG
jgi:hypothetical protein